MRRPLRFTLYAVVVTAVTTATVFHDALHRNRFADARAAKDQLENAVRELEKHANEWKKL